MGEKEALQKRMESELAKCASRLAQFKGKQGTERLLKEIEGLEEELDACQYEIKAIERTAAADLPVAEDRILKRFEGFRNKLERTRLSLP